MSKQPVITTARVLARRVEPTYYVTLGDSGKWLHSAGSDFLFAYIQDGWDAGLTKQVTAAFESALSMSSVIKKSVLTTSGQAVENGLYLLDQPTMTKSMNAIDGMGETDVTQDSKSGSGTSVTITKEFFTAVLGGLSGDVAPMLTYLTTQMGDIQAQVNQSTVTSNFGTIVGMVSVMPVLGVVTTSFQYVFSTESVSEWFVSVPCGSTEHQSYDYAYTKVNYNYVAPAGND